MMQAVKHSKKFADKVGIPQSVGDDFTKADKRAGKFQGKGAQKRGGSKPPSYPDD
jgi:hypothetical protein